MRELAGEHNPEERRQFTRAATLLQRLAFPAYLLVVGRPPEGGLDLLKSQPGDVQVCTAGVSIEPLGDAAHPTYLDAIRLAQGCHDYSGGHSGTEGEAWHGAIDLVVDVLKRAAVGPWDGQLKAVYGVGMEAQAEKVEELEPVAELDDQHREAVHQAVAEALGSGAYDCLRVWEAWGVGTMGPDDFVPVAEDSDRVAEIADAAIEAIRAIPLPAPEVGETGEVAELVALLKIAGRWATSTGVHLDRFAALFDQQEAELAALRAVPVAVSERLRVVKAGISAGYNLGHHHTVEGSWGDPDDVADDIAQETLNDIGLPPAPQCLIARMAAELDHLQPLPAFPPITSHPLAIEARALLRGGPTTIPAPQAGEGAVAEPVAECPHCGYEGEMVPAPQAGDVALAGDRRSAESLQLAHESCRSHGDCPDSEICWLDMLPCSHYENCATPPAPQAGEVEA
jgi:hypothetical protein